MVTAPEVAKGSISPFHLTEQYLDSGSRELELLGLPEQSWFVAVHIRTAAYANDVRSVDEHTLVPAINDVIAAGGFVIRFGTTRQKPLIKHPQFIDLSTVTKHQLHLHAYLLQRAEFLLTTNSGPAVVAHLLGTDLVQINTSALARNTLSSWASAYYLPAVHVDASGDDIPLPIMFQDKRAWWEPQGTQRKNPGRRYQRSNTSEEVRLACQDMLTLKGRSNEGRLPGQALEIALRDIRRETGAVSFGTIAPSFLEGQADHLT